MNVKSKFWGKSLEIHPLGISHVKLSFLDGFEHYSWRKVTTCVNNLIVGSLWIDHYGEMCIKNWRTGEEVVLTFVPKASVWFGWNSDNSEKSSKHEGCQITGKVLDSKGIARYEICGSWDSHLVARNLSKSCLNPILDQITLWKRNEMPLNSKSMFDFTSFARYLNEISPLLKTILPSTDSRLRSDQRALEEGKWSEANLAKENLESRQRDQRKLLIREYEETGKANGPSTRFGLSFGEVWWTPRWFERQVDLDTKEEYWRFTGDYWKNRQEVTAGGNWPDFVVSSI